MDAAQTEQNQPGVERVATRQIGGLPLICPILEALQVRETVNQVVPSEAEIDLGRIVLGLVANRLLAPQPLCHVGSWLATTVLPELWALPPAKLYDNRLGRALDRLYPHLAELWAHFVTQAVVSYHLDLSVLHWDITSLYFEGAYTDSALVRYGYSRDHRPDTKQINLEVDVTHDGYVPIWYQPLTGNTADITRPVPHLHALLRLLAQPALAARRFRPVLVSDSKLVTPAAVAACHQQRLFYLGPLPATQYTDALVRSVPMATLQAHPLAYRPQRAATCSDWQPYCGVWRAVTFEHDAQCYRDRALVVWSAGKQRLDVQKRKTYLKRLLNGLATLQKQLNTRRYKKRRSVEQRLRALQQRNPAARLLDIELRGVDNHLALRFRINRRRLAAAQAVDGRYALATNAAHLSANQVLTLFKGQDGVEKRFRTVKGPLHVRPLFVRRDERIAGLVFITLLALLVRALLERACRQHHLAASADRLLAQFAPLQAVDLHWTDGRQQRQAVEPTAEQQHLLQTLAWPPLAHYAHLDAIPP